MDQPIVEHRICVPAPSRTVWNRVDVANAQPSSTLEIATSNAFTLLPSNEGLRDAVESNDGVQADYTKALLQNKPTDDHGRFNGSGAPSVF